MNAEEFRRHGRQMVDYIADYMENIREREVVHRVSPGYLRGLLPKEAPQNPENFDEVFKDVEKYIMPGVSSEWNSGALMHAHMGLVATRNMSLVFSTKRD